jgi:hypothetical protein
MWNALESVHNQVLDIRADPAAFPPEKQKVAMEVERMLMRVVRCEIPPAHGANVIKAGALMLENMLGRHSTQVNVTQRVTLEALVMGSLPKQRELHVVDALVLPAAQAADGQPEPCSPTESGHAHDGGAPAQQADRGGGAQNMDARPAPGALPPNANQLSDSLPLSGDGCNPLVDGDEG